MIVTVLSQYEARRASKGIRPPLACYSSVSFERLHWVPLGSGGGFSGSLIWRGDFDGLPLFALKRWPESLSVERLARIHQWMKQAAHLPFVPEVMPTKKGMSVAGNSGRIWDLTRWMPGSADFHAKPSAPRLANACTALAQIHRVWKPESPRFEVCPGVTRRLRILAEWKQLARMQPVPTDSVNEVLSRGFEAVTRLAEPAEKALRPWLMRPMPVQPCLCDIWHDHVLFTDDSVTGIIDYGAMKEDHPAVDLARLLGDLIGEDNELFELGLAAYRAELGVSEISAEFVRLLDRTGIVGAMIVWLLRFQGEFPTFSHSAAVLRRIARLADRLEAIRGF
ncbi:MAG TPA: phosphotransferase [Urbifossiella sp.]